MHCHFFVQFFRRLSYLRKRYYSVLENGWNNLSSRKPWERYYRTWKSPDVTNMILSCSNLVPVWPSRNLKLDGGLKELQKTVVRKLGFVKINNDIKIFFEYFSDITLLWIFLCPILQSNCRFYYFSICSEKNTSVMIAQWLCSIQ